MKKYYKGHIIFNKELSEKTYDIAFIFNTILKCSDKDFYDKFVLLNKKEQEIIQKFLMENRNDNIIIPDKIKSIFNKIFSDNKLSYYSSHESIIYELIIDEHDEYYAKEIITGNIFPIVRKSNINLDYEINKERKVVGFINNDDYSDGLIGTISGEHLFITNNGTNYYFGKNPYNESFFHLKKLNSNKERNDYSTKYFKANITLFNLVISNYLNFNNIDRCEVFVNQDMIANQQEIDYYLNKYKNVFGNKRYRKEFINNLNSYANQNVFKGEIIPKKDEIKVIKLDDITKLMERIELGLLKLKSHNEALYYKLNKEYNDLLNNQEDTLKIPLTKSYLESLEAKILFSLKFDKNNGGNIINYLNYQKDVYLNYFLNGEDKSLLTIGDIDNLMELCLKMQNEFDIKSKRIIIRNISLLYLLELYENKDELMEYNFNNSYLNECIISIILWLNTFLELNIIKTDYIIDINNNYSLDDIIMIIKNMKLNFDQEKIKKLSL